MPVPDEEWVSDEALASLVPPDRRLEALRAEAQKYLTPQQASTPTRPQAPQHGNTRYPWELWADGEYHEAIQGVDFNLTVSKFQVALHRKAADLGNFVKTIRVRGVDPPTVGFLFGNDRDELAREWARLENPMNVEL